LSLDWIGDGSGSIGDMLGGDICGMLGAAGIEGIGAGEIIGDIVGGGIDSCAGDWASAWPTHTKKPAIEPARFRADDMIAPEFSEKHRRGLSRMFKCYVRLNYAHSRVGTSEVHSEKPPMPQRQQ
jgi:hypothetical protein